MSTIYRIERPGADRLLVLLHGWSAEQHHLAAYVPLVDPEERYTAVSPRALHDLPDGDGASWYERGPEGPAPDSFRAGLEAVVALIERECASTAIPPERCVVAGFSQGGFLALAVAGRPGAPVYGGVWAMCCGLPEVPGLELDFSAGRGRPALVQVGAHDPVIPPERGRAAADRLAADGWDVRFASYDMAHSQRLEMLVDAHDWLGSIS